MTASKSPGCATKPGMYLRILTLGCLFLVPGIRAAQTEPEPPDLTIAGQMFRRAVVTTNAMGITVQHRGGISTFDFRDLPEDERDRFGYDPAIYRRAYAERYPPPPMPPDEPMLAFRRGVIHGLTAPARLLHVRETSFLPQDQRTNPYRAGIALGGFGLFILIYVLLFIHRKKKN